MNARRDEIRAALASGLRLDPATTEYTLEAVFSGAGPHTLDERAVLAVYLLRRRHSFTAPDVAEICRRASMSGPSVRRALDRLRAHGWIPTP